MKTAAFLLLALVSAISPSNGHVEWGILTKQNFSSQIQLHPHVLLFVTVPWCGESRFLMKEVTQLVANRHEEFGSLKLMVLYRNSEKTLAQAIGAAEGITIFCYHHGVPYNYQGKLRAWNILFSIRPYLSASPEELPLKHLKSEKDLETFLESTDKALLLLDFCGWTPALLSKLKKNVSEDISEMHGDFSGEIETDRMLMLRGKEKQKATQNGHMMCGIQSGFGGIPWLQDFSLVNDISALRKIESVNPGFGQTCTFEDYKQFSSFVSKLIAIAKEFSLPPERHRFGLVTERSLVLSLGVGESDSWLAVLQSAGCPHCSKILKVGDDVKRYLNMENPIVTELEVDGEDLGSSFPATKPSVILFVDRSCDLSEDRRRSEKALSIFREVAVKYQMPDVMKWENNSRPEKSINQASQEVGRVSGLSSLKITPEFKKIKLENKVSLVILDGDKNVALDNVASALEGSSLRELLSNLLHRTRETKLSSIAKDVGFRLLSDDLDIKILDTLPSEPEVLSGQVSSPPSVEGTGEITISPDEFNMQSGVDMPSAEKDEMKSSEVRSSSPDGEEENVFANMSEQSAMMDADELEVSVKKNVKVEIETSSRSDSKEELAYSFKGSFFFSDGNYRLLRALTGESKIPSAVIIDPALQQHFVFHSEAALSYSSLADFLRGYLNGSLLPYKQSESRIQIPREAPAPPFVNLDFHEVDPIPRVTVNTFSQLVQVMNQSAAENASCPLKEDVLVLFSNSWCGFCQRMELVVHELYRSLKRYTKTIKGGSGNNQILGGAETTTNGANVKPPLIYLMDCTLNDCSFILKSINQREVYPALTLFPAERREVVPYDGDTSVADIIEFLARHGNNSREFLSKNGILSTVSGNGRRSSNTFGPSSAAAAEEVSRSDKLFEVVLRSRVPKRAVQHTQVKPQSPAHSGESASHVKAGTFLVATDKLLSAHPFDKSRILLVKAEPETGFLGLIVNKRLRWESFPELGESVDFLKEAPLSFGGPVVDPRMPLVALTRNDAENQHPEVMPGVYFLNQSAISRGIEEFRSGNKTLADYWFFLGYSSWSYDQLFDEISQGAWAIENDETGFAWP